MICYCGITAVSSRTHATLQWIREVAEELQEFADYLATPQNTDSFPVGPRIHDLDGRQKQA